MKTQNLFLSRAMIFLNPTIILTIRALRDVLVFSSEVLAFALALMLLRTGTRFFEIPSGQDVLRTPSNHKCEYFNDCLISLNNDYKNHLRIISLSSIILHFFHNLVPYFSTSDIPWENHKTREPSSL